MCSYRLLGSVVGGFRLMTLTELKLETSLRSNVRERFPWMGAADIQADQPAGSKLHEATGDQR
jgi:hypothetical protein